MTTIRPYNYLIHLLIHRTCKVIHKPRWCNGEVIPRYKSPTATTSRLYSYLAFLYTLKASIICWSVSRSSGNSIDHNVSSHTPTSIVNVTFGEGEYFEGVTVTFLSFIPNLYRAQWGNKLGCKITVMGSWPLSMSWPLCSVFAPSSQSILTYASCSPVRTSYTYPITSSPALMTKFP